MTQQNKALTVKQPWAWAIIHGGKDVENRSKPTKHRGQLYIHAGKGWADEGIDAMGIDALPKSYDEFLAGMVIGTVDLVGHHHADECGGVACAWGIPGFYHWELANARPLATPFPETGKLGIWNLGATK